MGINIRALYEEAEGARCNRLRGRVLRAHAADASGLEDVLERDLVVPMDEARKAVGDWDAFSDRNSLDPDSEYVYIGSLKKADRPSLAPLAKEVCTGWADMEKLSEADRAKVLSVADETMTGWDMLSFDEMNGICAGCPLSWDKGRGCLGAFGPENSLLPSIAARHGCPIVASVPERARSGEALTMQETEDLIGECAVLREKLPEEGKMMVRRYSGPVDRMEAAARACVSEGCRLCFFRSRVPVKAHQGRDHVLDQAHHALHPGAVVQILRGVQRVDDRQRIGAGHEHAVVEQEVHHLVVYQGPSLMGVHRDRPADLSCEPEVTVLEHQMGPLEEGLHDAGARPRVRGRSQ